VLIKNAVLLVFSRSAKAFGKVFAANSLADRLASYGEPILTTGLLNF
jgi:hypothetical protein